MSNMAPPRAQLETWVSALTRYARALKDNTEIVDAVAKKSRPAARAEYQSALASAAGLAADDPSGAAFAADGAALAEQAFALFARLEQIREALDAGGTAVSETALFEEAARQMSRTFLEGVNKKRRTLRAAKDAAAAAARAGSAALVAAWSPAVAAGEPRDVAKVYAANPKTEGGAALFASVLVAWEKAGKDVQKYTEAAKDQALGALPDTPETIAAAVAARASMHPLQAMEITFGLIVGTGVAPAAAAPEGAAVVIDATLPQARTAVRYNLAPLIDARAAAEFGPLANIFTGLNYRLVNRLRTITEEPVPGRNRRSPAAKIVVPGAAGATSDVVRTIDGGATAQLMVAPLPASAYAAVGAGPRPRVARLGELLETAVFSDRVPAAAGAARTIKNPEQLLEDYGANADNLAPFISLDELGNSLIARFTANYAASPPGTVEEFKSAALGIGDSRDPLRSYIALAISEVSKRGADARLLKAEASGARGASQLFGGRELAARGGRQETILTTLLHLRQSASAAAGRLLQAYDKLGIGARAHRVYAPADSGAGESKTARAARESRQLMEALGLYRAMVGEAFYDAHRKPGVAQVEEKLDTVEPRPSLKLYVLERGDTSAEAVR